MQKRRLFIAAYDVSHPARLRRVHKVVKRFATGGQKSAFECFLTASERSALISGVLEQLDQSRDRFALLQVEERTEPLVFGIAEQPSDPLFYYVG